MDAHHGRLGMHIFIIASLQQWLMLYLSATTSNVLLEFFKGPVNPTVVVGGW
jgi:hypothetical protein